MSGKPFGVGRSLSVRKCMPLSGCNASRVRMKDRMLGSLLVLASRTLMVSVDRSVNKLSMIMYSMLSSRLKAGAPCDRICTQNVSLVSKQSIWCRLQRPLVKAAGRPLRCRRSMLVSLRPVPFRLTCPVRCVLICLKWQLPSVLLLQQKSVSP